MRCTCSSLSMTQGPAIRTSGRPRPNAAYSIGTRILRFGLSLDAPHQRLRLAAPAAVFVRRSDKRLEQRMRLHRLALEFGMELAPQEPRVVRDLADLDVRVVRRLARNAQSRG